MKNYRQCPACSCSMFITDFQGHEVDQCPSCAGVWFDNDEIHATYDNLSLPESNRQCPHCRDVLLEADLLDGHAIRIDICSQKHGAFVDYEELEHVRHSKDIQSAIKEVEQKTGAKSWLFQFFTLMPVEYNIRPKSKPVVTQALIALNILIFLLQHGSGMQLSDAPILEWGFIPAHLSEGSHLYTLISSQFLHGSWMHLLGNMYFLYIIGDNIEDVLGKVRYVFTYLALGIIACLGHWLLNAQDITPMVGASGAISGLFGMYVVLFRRAMLTQMFVFFQFKLPVWGYFLIWFSLNLLGQVVGGEGIAYMAHIGGFAAGIALALVTYSSLVKHYPLIACLNSGHFNARYKKSRK